jgi:hypothetical protein
MKNLGLLRAGIRTGLILTLSGCGGESAYETARVLGKVTLNGQPLADARVLFEPEPLANGVQGPGSQGMTDAQGRFELTTIDGKRGAVVGTHNVLISTLKMKVAQSDIEDPEDVIIREKVPAEYKGKLSFLVPKEGASAAGFDLKGPPPNPRPPAAARRGRNQGAVRPNSSRIGQPRAPGPRKDLASVHSRG